MKKILLPVLALATACTDAGLTDVRLRESGGDMLVLVVVGSPHRTGFVGQELPGPVIARLELVREGSSRPAPGVVVTFVVTEGNGTLQAGTSVTDERGLAWDHWTLGPEAGTNAVEIRALGEDGMRPLRGTVTATAFVPSALGDGFGPEQFALIQEGVFEMGNQAWWWTGVGWPDEFPVHWVSLTKPFAMQRTEVTQGQWRAVMGENPSWFSSCGDLCPVESVSWHDVQAFLRRLNELDPGKGYRLPTEAEWEYACRAGTIGEFAGTEQLNDMGWHGENSGRRPQPVARKLPNAWGLYDMHGNVWEWVQDWYSEGYYAVSPTADPPGPETGWTRVVRGGAWGSPWYEARSTHRSRMWPNDTDFLQGFRLVRDP